VFSTPFQRVAREVKNTKDYFLNWPPNTPIKIGDYGFYNGRNVKFDWQGNLSTFGIQFVKASDNMPMSESFRSSGSVSVQFDTEAGTPASANLKFSKKHSIAFESHGGVVEVTELDKLHHSILECMRDGKINWNPHWVVVTQIYRVGSFSSFVSGMKGASANVVAKGVGETSLFGLADPSAKLEVGASAGMALANVAEQNALPFFVVSKLKGKGHETRMERYG